MADQYKQLSHTAESVDDLLGLAASHASDTTSHITETERQSWNGKADASALSSETSARVAADAALQTAIDGKASSSDLTDETSAREAADTALQTAINGKVDTANVFGVGTLIQSTDDLFTLPVGKYYRNTSPTGIANIPSDLTVAFYCEIVNTIADNRRKIYLYPATIQTAGVFYTCLETGSGYGTWYKFSGEVVQ